MTPHAGEIRDGCGALCIASGQPSCRRHRLRQGGRRSRCHRCQQQKEFPLPVHVHLPFSGLSFEMRGGGSWLRPGPRRRESRSPRAYAVAPALQAAAAAPPSPCSSAAATARRRVVVRMRTVRMNDSPVAICRVGKARTCPRVSTAAVRVGTAREERSFAHPTLAYRSAAATARRRAVVRISNRRAAIIAAADPSIERRDSGIERNT